MRGKLSGPGVWLAALAGIVLGVGLTAGTVYVVTRTTLQARFFAKNLCSCLYVTGQSETLCRDYAAPGPPWLLSAQVDVINRRVVASSLVLIRAPARYLGPRAGCALDP